MAMFVSMCAVFFPLDVGLISSSGVGTRICLVPVLNFNPVQWLLNNQDGGLCGQSRCMGQKYAWVG